MPSVVGLLEEHELGARQRVESLREERDRLLAELAGAEAAWERFVIAKETVSRVLSEPREDSAGQAVADAHASAPGTGRARAVPGSVVPVWREGLETGALAPDYRRIMAILSDRDRSGEGAMGCRQLAGALGLELVPAKVEGVRSKAKRLVERGWLVQRRPGMFSVADGRGGGL
jgi:hypothetical protein